MDWYDGEVAPNYTIFEHRLRIEEEQEEDSNFGLLGLQGEDWEPIDNDPRQETLSIDLDSITVEHIESVTIKSKQYNVDRLKYFIHTDEPEDV